MSFWNRDLPPRSWGPRQRLALRDWLLVPPVYTLSWALTYGICRLGGSSQSQAVFFAIWGGLLGCLVSSVNWLYPAVADIIPSKSFKSFAVWLLAGFILLGFELHAGNRNVYEIIFSGIPKKANWHLNGFSLSIVAFIASYASLLTAARRLLWITVDKRRSSERDDVGGIHPSKDR